MLVSSLVVLFACLISCVCVASPIPIVLANPENAARMKFHVLLPSNETVQIKLTFRLLAPSKALPLYGVESPVSENLVIQPNGTNEYEEVESTSSSTTEEASTYLPTTTEWSTTTIIENTATDIQSESSSAEQLQIMTVEEAIEAFRQHLIQKEMEIAGIIESNHAFYRHFNLEYDNGTEIPIRCTYEAKFTERSLKISCYEYRQYGSERIFSNGEIAKTEAMTSSSEYINVKSLKQTYSMTIS